VPNTFAFPQWVSMDALRFLLNKLEVLSVFNTEWQKEFERDFPIGSVTQVKIPQSFLIRDGLGYNPQAINRLTTTINCNQIFGVDFEWDSFEQALNMERSKEEIRKQYLEPGVAQQAQEWDSRAALFAYQNTNNGVGTLGTDPNTVQIFAQARQRLFELACPPSGEKAVCIPPQVSTSMVPALQTLLNPQDDISKQFKEGSLGKLHGFDVYECMSLWRHTAGTNGATTVNTANVNNGGNQIGITTTAGFTWNAGDIITIANVNQVNPRTRRFLSPIVKQFVVLQPLTALGAGNAADFLIVSPALFGPGSQYQNVDNLPVNGATITAQFTSAQSGAQALVLHGDAFGVAGVKLEEPKATEMTSQARDPETRMALRFIRMFDPVQSKMINRWDTVGGFGQLYSDSCAVRIFCA
jgi:P22 coat protein - gene protein 5